MNIHECVAVYIALYTCTYVSVAVSKTMGLG